MDVPFPMEQRMLIERLARHLAAESGGDWPLRMEEAANILALMKEPDPAMRAAGDVATWQAMIDAALMQRWTVLPPASPEGETGSADEEGEIALPPEAVDHDDAKWIHLHTSTDRPAKDMP